MNFRDIFHFNYLRSMIKLNEREDEEFPESENDLQLTEDDDIIYVNEWRQEYELIYQSYILEK